MNEFSLKVIVETCARAAHEANRAYCIACGDFSQKPWEDAGDSIQRSSRLVLTWLSVAARPSNSTQHGWPSASRMAGCSAT